MNHVKYFKQLFQSIHDNRKIVLLLFLIENDNDLLTDCGFLKNANNRLCLELKNI